MTSTTINSSASQEITFVLNNLPDLATLLAGLPADAEVHVLDSDGDALREMVDFLDERSGINAIHLLSHGEPGAILLGQMTLCRDTLPRYDTALRVLSAAMAGDGEWLIYGCEVAKDDTGRAFIKALRELTGLNIAAASHKVGSVELGGRWLLDDSQNLSCVPLRTETWTGILGTVQFDFSSIFNADVIVTINPALKYPGLRISQPGA